MRKWFLFLLAFSLALSAGYYQTTKAEERGKFKISLPDYKEEKIVLDVAKQGLPKQLVQPNRVQISASVLNNGTEPIPLQVKLTGLPKGTILNVEDSNFNPETEVLTKTIHPKDTLSCKLLVSLLPESRSHYRMAEGTFEIYNPEKKTVLARVPIYIINSEIPDPNRIIIPKQKNAGNAH